MPGAVGSSLWDIQVGFYSILNGDTLGLMALAVGGVHDGTAPATTPTPYVILGEWTEVPNDRLSGQGRISTVAIHIYSNYEGSKVAKQITNRIIGLLLRQSYPTGDWHITDVQLDSVLQIQETDEMRHTVVRLRIWTQPRL